MSRPIPATEYFDYDHLSPHLHPIAKPFAELAHMLSDLPSVGKPGVNQQDFAAGMDKLREAKDYFVGAFLRVEPFYPGQLTLGKLIEILERLPEDCRVETIDGNSIADTGSARAVYSEVALNPVGSWNITACYKEPLTTAGALLEHLRGIPGSLLHGYRGGTWTAGLECSLWVADYDRSGYPLGSVRHDGLIGSSPEVAVLHPLEGYEADR